MRNVYRLLTIVLLISILSLSNTLSVLGEETKMVLKTLPQSSILNAANMAPGDEIISTLDVKYEGNTVPEIYLNPRKEKGSSDLYKQLNITVEDNKKILFKGGLLELNNLDLGKFNDTDSKKLTFKVSLPSGLKNEYQGVETVVAFDFSAKAFPADYQEGSLLPNTATNTFNILVIGILLISSGFFFLSLNYLNRKKKEV
jgi:LPXTG-motif cell wall-anchored protein